MKNKHWWPPFIYFYLLTSLGMLTHSILFFFPLSLSFSAHSPSLRLPLSLPKSESQSLPSCPFPTTAPHPLPLLLICALSPVSISHFHCTPVIPQTRPLYHSNFCSSHSHLLLIGTKSHSPYSCFFYALSYLFFFFFMPMCPLLHLSLQTIFFKTVITCCVSVCCCANATCYQGQILTNICVDDIHILYVGRVNFVISVTKCNIFHTVCCLFWNRHFLVSIA